MDDELKAICNEYNVEYMTTPCDRDMVDHIDKFVQAYKIGSGDITWTQHINYISSKQKPVLLGSVASPRCSPSGKTVQQHHNEVGLLQCNTNYTEVIVILIISILTDQNS